MGEAILGARQSLRDSTKAIGTSYDASPDYVIKVQGFNTLTLLVNVALNTATSVEVQVEFATPASPAQGWSPDPLPVSTDWYARASGNSSGLTVSGGIAVTPQGATAYSFGATGTYEIMIWPIMAKWVRVKAKTTGGPGTTTCSVIGVQGIV